ncbi:HMCN [Mytilus coruscus]|uniref:HMCN n=1 Tax=Mytilus coruscus TaxID=42192 RepID=A0A6J8ELH6_MYTCO|nr:HMCN [Mytilus coruscus]
MGLVNLCLFWLFLQDKSMLTDANITIYTTEGSTVNLTLKSIASVLSLRKDGKRYTYYDMPAEGVIIGQYGMILRPDILEFQIINVTANDTGFYSIGYLEVSLTSRLTITNTSCPSSQIKQVCAIVGSSPILTFIYKWPVYKSKFKVNSFSMYWIRRSERIVNVTIYTDIQIYNVTHEDEGFYRCVLQLRGSSTKLQVVNLRFINQTDKQTIVGQEGTKLDINCTSDTTQIITALKLESNGTIKAIGDNQTVSYSFIPDRTDHMTKYKCMDSAHSSIMIEVKLIIRYAPEVTIRYTNGTIECNGNGVPPIYGVYRLDQISKLGELVRSVNLNNETFILYTELFPYQRNGKYTCVVSNSIPDTNGKILQTLSTNVNYEGPPVFAKENRYVKIGKVGQSSVTMSFHVYSCPDVEEIFLEKLGRIRGQKRKIHKFVLKSTLLYNEFDNKDGIPGYDILIESDELYIDDLQPYCITVTNRLGASEYHFAITKKGQHISISMDDSNIIDDKEQSSDQKSQNSNDSDSESSQNVMVGNVGGEYENPYQTVLQDRPESHQYTQITIERNTSISSAESNCEMQILEKSSTKEAGYINLQF